MRCVMSSWNLHERRAYTQPPVAEICNETCHTHITQNISARRVAAAVERQVHQLGWAAQRNLDIQEGWELTEEYLQHSGINVEGVINQIRGRLDHVRVSRCFPSPFFMLLIVIRGGKKTTPTSSLLQPDPDTIPCGCLLLLLRTHACTRRYRCASRSSSILVTEIPTERLNTAACISFTPRVIAEKIRFDLHALPDEYSSSQNNRAVWQDEFSLVSTGTLKSVMQLVTLKPSGSWVETSSSGTGRCSQRDV